MRTERRATGYERDGLAPFLAVVRGRGLEVLRLGAEDRFLDVGCATGAAVREAALTVGRAVGVDCEISMLRQARLLAGDRACFVLGDAHSLPFKDESFTAVLCTSALQYFDDPSLALREIRRVLTVDGRLSLGVLTFDDRHLARMVRNAGLRRESRQYLITALGAYKVVTARRQVS